jgi:hypothetical protein
MQVVSNANIFLPQVREVLHGGEGVFYLAANFELRTIN